MSIRAQARAGRDGSSRGLPGQQLVPASSHPLRGKWENGRRRRRRESSALRLGRRALAWRIVHGVWSILQLTGLAYIWRAAITRRRGRRIRVAVTFLVAEGGGLVIGRGNCPVGPMQAEWGDPVPFFELILPPRAAKAAVPILAMISVAALATLALRPPREAPG